MLCLVSVAVLVKKVMSFLLLLLSLLLLPVTSFHSSLTYGRHFLQLNTVVVVVDVVVVVVVMVTADIVVLVIVVVGGGVVVGSGLAISTTLNGCEVVVALFSFRCSSC